MARFPESFGSDDPEKKSSTTDDSKKKTKLGRFIASETRAKGENNSDQAERSKPRTLGELIIESRAKKAEAKGEQIDQDEATQLSVEDAHDTQESDMDITDAEHSETSSYEDNAEFPETEPDDKNYEQDKPANALYGGEVIIPLTDDAPIVEHVLPLRTEQSGADQESIGPEAGEPETAETAEQEQATNSEYPYEQYTSQTEQQHQSGPGFEAQPTPEADDREAQQQSNVAGEADSAAEPEPPYITPHTEVPHSYDPPAESDNTAQTEIIPPPAPANQAERLATKQDVDAALYRSAKLNTQRGLLSGLLLGTYFANRKLRRQQKQEAKQLTAQGKELTNVRKELQTVQTLRQVEANRNERNFTNINKQLQNNAHSEKLGQKQELQKRQPESQPIHKTIEPQEQLQVPDGHHLETSAWHAIEVDSKTGKPVETPSFQYGHEYYRERAQEGTPAAHRNALAGTALVAAAMAQGQGGNGQGTDESSSSPSSSQVPDASTQGVPTDAATNGSNSTSKDKTNGGQAGPIWPWIVALVAVVICLLVALR